MASDHVPEAAQVIGKTVRALRRNRGWTIEVLAERAQLSYQYVSTVENGRSNFSIEVLNRLAAAFQVSLVDVLVAAYPPGSA